MLTHAMAPSKSWEELLGTEGAVIRDHRTPAETVTSSPSRQVPVSGQSTGGTSNIVGSGHEPDYLYPWEVRLSASECHGVLINPQWVLTAAHCVDPIPTIPGVYYSRTDPSAGTRQEETSLLWRQPNGDRSVYVHPDHLPGRIDHYDIALVRVNRPVDAIHPLIQTVGLPTNPRRQGVVGTVASIDHVNPLPLGQAAIYREPLPEWTPGVTFTIFSHTPLRKGDSGSGFVTLENGRATVRGIVSSGNALGDATFIDVDSVRNWILETMKQSQAMVDGNTRLRWSGLAGRGTMTIGCSDRSRSGPLEVEGVMEGLNCQSGPQVVSCELTVNQPRRSLGMDPTLEGIRMFTVLKDGTSVVHTYVNETGVRRLTINETLPPEAASREYTCLIGSTMTTIYNNPVFQGTFSSGPFH